MNSCRKRATTVMHPDSASFFLVFSLHISYNASQRYTLDETSANRGRPRPIGLLQSGRSVEWSKRMGRSWASKSETAG